MSIFQSIKTYLGSATTPDSEDFVNEDISNAILAALHSSVRIFSAGDFKECATHMRVNLSREHYAVFRNVFPTAVANAVNNFLAEFFDIHEKPLLNLFSRKRTMLPRLRTQDCCFEIAVATEKHEDYPHVEISRDIPEHRSRNTADHSGECVATVMTVRNEKRLDLRFERLPEPEMIDDCVYFKLRFDDSAPDQSSPASPRTAPSRALASLTVIAGPNFKTRTGGGSNTHTMRSSDETFSGRHAAPGSGDAVIDSESVNQGHFAIHERSGQFYVEPFGAMKLSGVDLITEGHPWAPLQSGDTLEIADAAVKIQFRES